MEIDRFVRAALREDRAFQDVTSRLLVPPGAAGGAVLVSRGTGVLSGAAVAARAFLLRDPRLSVRLLMREGRPLRPGSRILSVRGPLASILSAERTALNILGHLSGVATLTSEYVRRAGGRAAVLDTRKTLPGLRDLEKAAVRAGGGVNHRRDLSDAVLIKENHLDALAGESGVEKLFRAIRSARRRGLKVILEARDRKEILWGLVSGVDVLLLDNFSPAVLPRVVKWIRTACRQKGWRRPLLEVSGGVSLETVGRYSRAGVDRISVGKVTHSAPWFDVGLDLEPIRMGS